MTKCKRVLRSSLPWAVVAAVLVAMAGLLMFYDPPRVLGQGDVSAKTSTSSDAYLRSLSLSGIVIEHDSSLSPPGFSPTIFSYSVGVAHTLTETTVTATANLAASYVVKLGGVEDADGTISLAVGSNVISVEVTAGDGVTKQTYTVTVSRAGPPSTDATLSGLRLNGIDIGTFGSSKTSYKASVYNSVSQTTVTPTLNRSGGSYVIKLGTAEDADGTVSLAVGSNVVTVVVTAEDGQTTKTYKVTVNRATATAPTTGELSTDDPPVNFRNVSIGHSSAIYSFSFPRNRGIFGWVIQRYEHDGDSFVSSGPDMGSAFTGSVDLGGEGFQVGDTNVVPDVLYKWVLKLTNRQSSTVIETSLTVRSPALSSDATLSALTLSGLDFGTFSSDTLSYTAEVTGTPTETTVSPTVNHSGASYVIKLGGVADSDGTVSLSVGSNVITIEVTAEDGQTTRTYTVTVTRRVTSSDAYLESLSLSGIALEHDSVFYPQGFSPLIFSYTANVANSLTETTVSITPYGDQSYVIKLGGVTDSDGTVSLAVGSNVITVEVTAGDGVTRLTYTVTVERAPPPSTDATLSGLKLSGIDIGTFSSGGTSYAANVYNSVSQTTVTPTLNDSGASHVIKLGGVTDSDGTVSLAVGSNVITVEVTAGDGQTTKTYKVTVNRATATAPTTGELSTDVPPVNFRNISIDHSTAIYFFSFPRNRGIFGWVIQRYEHDGNSFVSSGPVWRVAHIGAKDLGGEGYKFADTAVEPDVLYKWVVMLTNRQGSTVIETSVTVRSPALSSDATLSDLTLSGLDFGTFSSDTLSYTAEVTDTPTETTVTPTVNHSGASYVVKLGGVTDADGTVSLAQGSNVITVEVTAENDTTTQTYAVTVTRAEPPSTDATLIGLTLSGIDFGTFISGTTSYSANVANGVSRTTVTPTVNDSGASYVVKRGGVADADGTVSLSVGRNVITVEVTAEDTTTTKTYTVTVTRSAPSSTDASLSNLTLSGVDFGTFDSTTVSYNATVANSVTQTTVTPAVSDSGAGYAVKLGGVTDADGTVSLSVGRNVIAVEVTAADDSTTRTYTVTVTREEPPSTDVSALTPEELEQRVKDQYDVDENGVIDLEEAIQAIKDYFSGAVSLGEAVIAIQLYFSAL